MNSSNATVAAALATLEVLEAGDPYPRLFEYGNVLMSGLREAAKKENQNLLIQGPGPMFNIGFTGLIKVKDYRDTLEYDKTKLNKFIASMHNEGVRVIGRGLWYISASHTKEDIEFAIAKAKKI